jgi:serine/threonine-protein kinase
MRSMLGRPALAAALVLVLAAPALAQPKPNRPPQDVANDLVKQAITKSQQGEHLEAIDLYLQAYSLIPQHPLLSNVGNEYQKAGKPVEALKYFCMYLEKDPTGTNATYAASKAKALQIELGNKNVDDKNVCKPVPRESEPTPPPTPPDDGGVTGTDGLGETPPGGKDKGGGGSPGSTLKLAGMVAGGVGLVGVGVGSYFGVRAYQKSNILTDHDVGMEWQSDIRQVQIDGQKYEDRQILLTIAGGALTATGVALYIIGATRASSTEKLSIRPTATADSVGITFGRGF